MTHSNEANAITMTNQKFCYWLQGYFEISNNPVLDRERLLLIRLCLEAIEEPLGTFTQWLSDVLDVIEDGDYNPHLISFYTPLIKSELNAIFLHVIDQSYDTEHSLDTLLEVHRGEKTHDEL